MQTTNDVHQQFAGFFKDPKLKPFAYLVSKKLSEGHICLDLSELDGATDINGLAQSEQVAAAGGRQPFILHNNRLYLERYFAYESMIIDRILAFLKESVDLYQERTASLREHHDLIKQLFDDTEDLSALPAEEQVNWQLAAVVSGVLNSFTIITGGPGTGKTTTVARLLAVLYTLNPDMSVALAAPTGKAAMRMGESLKSARLNVADAIVNKFQDLLPTTVHRLLKTIPDTPYFRHNAAQPLLQDVVIVDEASMLDAALFAKLLDAIGPGTRLILLGDKDQLASVEAGSLLGDLCQVNVRGNMFEPETMALINELNNQATGCIPE